MPTEASDHETRLSTSRRWRLQFPLRTLLLVVAVAAVIVAVWSYATAPSADELMYRRLHRSIRAGQSLQEVEAMLGRGQRIKANAAPSYLDQQIADKWNGDGIRTSDEFLCYESDDANGNTWLYYFQFRNGQLINFDHREYATYHEPVVSAIQ